MLTLLAPLVAGAAGCAATTRSTYDQCRSEPASWGEGGERQGYVTERGLIGGAMVLQVDEVFVARIHRKSCLDNITVEGFGKRFESGPVRPTWDGAFASSLITKRLAVATYTSDDEAWVWLDGERHGPYEGIGIGPHFSRNGEHVAWASLDGSDQVLFVDGRQVRRGQRLLDGPFFYVLDDGRVAAPLLRSDGKHQILVGDRYDSGPLDELCPSWGFVVGPGSRWAFTAKRQGKWITVVDGQPVGLLGMPADCRVRFSDDGGRYGYLNMPTPGQPHERGGLMLDGDFTPLKDGATSFEFLGALPVVTFNIKLAPNVEDWEQTYLAVGVPTPQAPPSPNDYEPQRGYANRTWARVRIGESVGPKFDRITKLSRDEQGRVRYVGLRHDAPYDVIDNVITPAATFAPEAPPDKKGPAVAR
jgi:hypothetical protein